MFGHVIGLMSSPIAEWHKIRKKLDNGTCAYIPLVFILSLFPPICAYIGTTRFGWKISESAPIIKLTPASALPITVMYYLALVIGIFSVGYMIKWMGNTYVKGVKLPESVALASFVAVPLLLIGVFQIYPVIWLNFLIGLAALAYAVYLLYTGVPILMDIPQEKGFLYASAILAFGLVALVVLLVGTAFLWGVGFQPVFS